MSFYLLHPLNNKPNSVNGFKYLIYTKKLLKHMVIKDELCCVHDYIGKFNWCVDDTGVDFITSENIIIATFVKIEDTENSEIWINKKYI